MPVSKMCEWCNGAVTMSPSLAARLKHHFCGKECRAAWGDSKKSKVPCAYCGAILKKNTGGRPQKRHFCNVKCKSKWQSENTRGENAPRWAGGSISVPCAQCGKILKRQRCAVENRSKRFFCNAKCRGRWQSENIRGENHPNWTRITVLKCDYCGKKNTRPRWWAKREQKYHFCNSQCMGNHYKSLTGNARYNWRGGRAYYYGPDWLEQSEKARKRDGHRCRHCDIKQEKVSRKLDVHHIKPFNSFGYVPDKNENHKRANALTNLITLCSACHRKAESGHIAIQSYLF